MRRLVTFRPRSANFQKSRTRIEKSRIWIDDKCRMSNVSKCSKLIVHKHGEDQNLDKHQAEHENYSILYQILVFHSWNFKKVGKILKKAEKSRKSRTRSGKVGKVGALWGLHVTLRHGFTQNWQKKSLAILLLWNISPIIDISSCKALFS